MNELGCVVVPLVFLIGIFALTALIVAFQARGRAERLEAAVAQLLARLDVPETDKDPELLHPEPESVTSPPLSVGPPSPAPPLPQESSPPVGSAIESDVRPSVMMPSSTPHPGASAPAARPPFDWENVIGVKLFSWIAGIALALAGVLFLRHSIERGWLSPPVQLAIGLLAGAGLIALGELRMSRRYATTANAVDASGLAILYATIFAAHNVWHILPPFAAFMAIVGVTGLAVWLAIRRDSPFIALLGLMGGFAAPALLATDRDQPIALFGYLLAVNIGVAWVAYKRNWPLLTALSLLFTTLYQWHWVVRFLDASRLPIAAAAFLVFPLAGVIALLVASRRNQSGPAFERTTQAASALPLLFGLYAAAIPAYGENYRLLFSFLFIASAGLAALAILRRHEALHLLGALSSVVAFLVWFSNSWTREAWPHILAIAMSFQAIYLLAPVISERGARRDPRSVEPNGAPRAGFSGAGRGAVYAAPLLMFILPTLASFEPSVANPLWLGSATVIMLGAIGIWSARHDSGLPFVLAFLFAFSGELVWSATYLRDFRVPQGGVFFTSVSFVCFGVAAMAKRWRTTCPWLRSADYFGVSGLVPVWMIAADRSLHLPVSHFMAPGAMILVLAAIAAHVTRRHTPFAVALVISNVILILFSARRQEPPFPSLAVVAACAIAAFACGWAILRARGGAPGAGDAFSGGADEGMRTFPRKLADAAAPAAVSLVSGWFVTIVASDLDAPPGFGLTLFASTWFVLLILLLAATIGRHGLAVGGALLAVAGALVWRAAGASHHPLWLNLGFGLALFGPLLVYPLAVRGRLGTSLAPHLASVIAGIGGLFYFRSTLRGTPADAAIGLLPLAIAGILALLLRDLLRIDPRGAARPGRLSLMAGAVLALITAAVPLQLDNEWLTVAWALEAAALGWLWTRIDHRGLLYWSAGLASVVFARLVLNPAVFSYHDQDLFPILNWYLYTYALSAGALYCAAFWVRRTDDRLGPARASSLLSVEATTILFLLLNIEIADFYSEGRHLTFDFSGTLAQDLTYTLGWAVFAIAMLIAGIGLKSRAARIAAIGLLAVAVLKCFLHDLGRLGGLYRVGSLLGLAVSLALVAVLLQKFVLAQREELRAGG